MLPHAYPFRLAERLDGNSVTVCLSAGSPWSRGGALAEPMLIEAMAQAAMLLMARPEERSGAVLAGIDGAEFLLPVAPGDTLRATAKLLGRLGGVVKLAAALERGDQVVAHANLLLATVAR